jgi:hypothetical protein
MTWKVGDHHLARSPPMGLAGAFEKVAGRRAYVEDPQTPTNSKSGLQSHTPTHCPCAGRLDAVPLIAVEREPAIGSDSRCWRKGSYERT